MRHPSVAVCCMLILFAGAWLSPAPASAAGNTTQPPLRGAMSRFTIWSTPIAAPDDVPMAVGENERATLSDYRGKVLLVNFWATWCPPCIREMPVLNALQHRLGGDRFQVLTVCINWAGFKAVKVYMENRGWTHLQPVADKGGKMRRALSVVELPTTFLIDHKGVIVGHYKGVLPWNSPDAERLFNHYIDQIAEN